MSNLLHKVKDAITGHHHGSGNKGSSQDPNADPNARDTYNSGDNLVSNTNTQDYGNNSYNSKPATSGTNYDAPGYTSGAYQDTRQPKQMPNQMNQAPNQMPGRMEGAGNTYSSSGMGNENRGAGGYGADQRDPNMLHKRNEAGDIYDTSNMRRDDYDPGSNLDSANKTGDYETGAQASKPTSDIYSSNELNSSAYNKIRKDPDNYGATNQGSSSGYDATTRTGDYGSDIGPHRYEPARGENDMGGMGSDPRESQEARGMGRQSENQGTYGDQMGQTRGFTSDYGSAGENTGGNTHRYETRSKYADPSMADQVEARAESEANTRMGQQGFGGGAAGGSSYNAPEAESGAHSSNLLNKLDPRVRSSDFEDSAMGNQRGF